MNLANLLYRTSRSDAQRPAIALGATVISDYQELAQQAAGLASALRGRLGLRPGDRVALIMKNTPEYAAALFGTWWAGLAAVPVNAKLHPRELDFILDDAQARLCLVTPELAEAVAGAAVISSGHCRVVDVTSREWTELLGSEPVPVQPVDAEELAWLFYTSGTTGRPKGAMLSHRSLLAMTACYYMDVDSVGPGDAILHAAPLSHGSGLYMLPHVAKAALHIIPESRGFDSEEIFALLRDHSGVTMFAAPTMVHRLVKSPSAGRTNTDKLKTIVYGGGPMYRADCEAALRLFGNKLVQIYGQGETPMTITALSKQHHADTTHPNYHARLASVGIEQSLVQVRVVDEAGATAAPGVVGEIAVAGPSLMSGYWNRPEATAETIRDGWLYTGDMGSLSTDGFLTLKDRSKDLIISGGTNIYPREVEEALLLHPRVGEAAVVGRPHEEWGEEVVAFVVTDAPVSEEELDAHCTEHIARFKRPKHYRYVTELPKNGYGKVLKTTLRDTLETTE